MVEVERIPKKDVIKWLHIMLDDKSQDLRILANDIITLNHQIRYFNGMHECFQNSVIDDLNDMMAKKQWDKKVILSEAKE